MASPAISKIAKGNHDFAGRAARISVAAIVAGTISDATGGKFANGAITGAFSRAFNDDYRHKAKTNVAKLLLQGMIPEEKRYFLKLLKH